MEETLLILQDNTMFLSARHFFPMFVQIFGLKQEGPLGFHQGGSEWWGARRVGFRRWEGPNVSLFFLRLPSHFRSFSLSGSLLVELWPRFKASTHPLCAFGFLWGNFVLSPAEGRGVLAEGCLANVGVPQRRGPSEGCFGEEGVQTKFNGS